MIPENPHKIFLNIRRETWLCFFLVIATLSVYWQVRNHEFVGYDDELYVTENKQVKSGLSFKNIIQAFTEITAANWHPLTLLSHMADVQFYGMNPGGHHLTSLFFHIINTLLLFSLLKRITADLWQSAFVSALFALHPLHVESSAQIAQRKDLVSTFFWFLTMQSYIRYSESPSINTYLPVILFFILGLMAKPMLVTLPFVLLLTDYWLYIRNPRSVKRNLKLLICEKIPLFVLVAGFSLVTFLVQQSSGAVRSLETYPLNIRIANALISYISYIIKMFLPYNLAFFYPYPNILPLWQSVGAFILLGLITLAAVRSMKERPYFITGWLWYMGALVPVIGLVQVGGQAMADRYTYVPLTGLFIILAWGIPELLSEQRYKKRVLAVISAAIFFIITPITWIQTGYWSSSIRLFQHALDVTTDNYAVHNNLGTVFAEKGMFHEAVKHYSEALRINPGYAKTHNNMGDALADLGKTEDAVRHYSETLRLNPNYAEAHNNMGVALAKQGNFSKAIWHYSKSLNLNPKDSLTHNNMGAALASIGKTDEAILHYSEALKSDPLNTLAYNNMGVALFQKGESDKAIAYFQKALQINPNDADARGNLEKISALKKE